MARFSTTKVQLSGYRLMVRQIDQAFSSRTALLQNSPLSTQTLMIIVGVFLACLIPAAGLFMAYMSPRAAQNGATMIITKSGGRYVMFDGSLHQVTNLASARLIVGKPDSPKVVKDSALAGQPRGQEMGVPSGPDNLTQRTDDTAKWTACDKHTDESDLSLTKTDSMTTTLFAGTDAMSSAVSPLKSDDAVVVKLASDAQRIWVIYNGSRVGVGNQDMATRAALGLTPAAVSAAIPISEGLFNAIPAAPALTTPYVAKRGQVNPALPQVLNGDVIITSSVDGTRRYQVALESGVEPISKFIAQLLINTGSKEITTVDPKAVAAAPLSSDINVSLYPDHEPNFREPHVVCWSWERGASALRATTTILIGESLPIAHDRADQLVPLMKSTGSVVTASGSVMTPGKGWFVRVTGVSPTSHANEQLMWIDDNGVRYFIGPDSQGKYDTTVKALGIGIRDPLPIPWQLAKLYAPGSTLSREAALTYHTLLPDDLHQKAIPESPAPAVGADEVATSRR
ncbi:MULTISPECIES: type VII secretion protein EccB [Mycobacterium avium complex (MAC)]|uniref:Type VII secretion protein EccB n=1 Tax=Mycobacterium intracellulare subsp. chimaera TaxID=222805 RepID=A0ABT7P6T1_MYCIT|nr:MULTISPECIES: type VII secretion protein EccB [Mycobacterium avium complex (MAC)]AOS94949.1 type VII secretion protein EccB [Mycobacterium intracellulare subsp. chimaera]MDM3928698.1 type VII secretion protein EccB [Mycobacterium intracellulare subsp. chimaera]PBA69065.1 type VII secretion protein EccB [Mycobacterium avium]